MAWRVHDAVVRGEIDNRTLGKVTGRIWLEGLPQPVLLDLVGNAHPDLAGCFLEFSNPRPAVDALLEGFNPMQQGVVGDMTASRKVRVPTVSEEEFRRRYEQRLPIPTEWANSLYLEWFSECNGRVVIEATHYACRISEPLWRLTPEEQEKQQEANAEAMQDFMLRQSVMAQDAIADSTGEDAAGENEAPSPESGDETGGERKPMDEFEAERFLKECDRRTDRYMELLEQYRDHPDRERLVAQEMGWDHIVEAIDSGALSEGSEGEEDTDQEEADDAWRSGEDDATAAATEDEEIEEVFGERTPHPLVHRAQRLVHRLVDDQRGKAPDERGTSSSPVNRLVSAVMCGSAKLAGALNRSSGEPVFEPGLTVAWLKRALAYLHEAIAATDEMLAAPSPAMAWGRELRDELMSIRQEILEQMNRFRGML